jgi:hypothetical protein
MKANGGMSRVREVEWAGQEAFARHDLMVQFAVRVIPVPVLQRGLGACFRRSGRTFRTSRPPRALR